MRMVTERPGISETNSQLCVFNLAVLARNAKVLSQKTLRKYRPPLEMETPIALVISNAEQKAADLEAGSNAPTITTDENIVDWEGPEDPQNPLNWSARLRYGHVVIVSLLSLVVNLAATMIAPGMEYVVRDIHITSQTIGTLSVTIYLLGFALGPLIISSASEMHGRLIVYHICNVLFIAFIVGAALSKTVPQFLIFRVLSGIAGSAPMTIGGGTIADVIPSEHRGPAGALFALGPLMGPEASCRLARVGAGHFGSWPSCVISLVALAFLRETHPNILLSRKADRLRRETGNQELRSKLDRRLTSSQILIGAFVRTGKLLLFSPIVLIMSLYVGLVFGLLYLLFTTITPIFQGVYGFKAELVGLAYLGIGIGELTSLVIFGTLSDRVSAWRTKSEGRSVPEHRLILMIWFAPVMTIGFFIYGWTAHYQVHWIAPIIGTFFIGFGAFFVILPAQIYLVDVFGSEAAASALGANILLRCLFGAFLPLAGTKMYETLNYGWGNTLLGFLSLAFVPAPMFFYKYGVTIPTVSTSLQTCRPSRTPLPDLRGRAPRQTAEETNPQWYAKLVANANRNVTDSNLARGNSTPIEARDESSKTSESGSIRLNASEARYVGSSHWASILDGIAELKDHLEAEEEIQTNSATPGSIPAPEDDMEMPLLYSVRSASRAQILDSIPPKQVLDRYISHYFNSLDLASGAFHTGKFMRENPSETPVMWLGLLYSIMCMAVMSYDLVGKSEVEDPKALIDQYREKTAQCLLLGKYANGGQYTWETIYQYVIIELSSRRDITQTIGILHGVSMNLLLQMGYHRDPSHFPSISPFAGEIRRRNWVKCLEGDLQMSMRTGIPRRISAGHWDTEEPRNLHDADFDEDTKEIPPSRPETEVTAVTQLIARRRMLVAVGAAVDLSSSIKPPAYTEVLAVDRQVREAEESLPPPLKMKPLQASVTDPPLLIMHRLYLALMFRIGEVMIHRKYLSEASDSFSYSRKKCLDSCLSVLQLQHTLNEETMVGGLLHFAGAKLSLIGNHAFLTACITLCGAMYKGLHAAGNEYASAREVDIKTALWNSLSVWMKNESSSREARIAAESIRLVLKKNGWFSELLPSPDLGSTSVNAMGLDSLGGFFGHGIDSFGEAPLTMFNNEWDPEGFPWFLDPLNVGMSLNDSQTG
ncbi:Pyrrolocin cluster transcription factor [Colletotrichum sp. SAR 10_86]|nr:Pyrrolocin cluster transcription factor [Colletotrichum sp. SAR 10_86]